MQKELIRQSKFLSLVLRHNPSAAGITLDDSGWVEVDVLVKAVQRTHRNFTRERLIEIVETNDKKRFSFSGDGTRIRAAQGHSIGVNLELAPVTPPERLYHGTTERFLPSIREQGLIRMKRDHVHLSPDEKTAHQVGMRHGRPVILVVRALDMNAAGHAFYLSDNGVWLTESVPVQFIQFPEPATPPAG